VEARLRYGNPSRKLKVIGITGTNGKTTTSNLIARILEENGETVALATTINFQLGKKKWENLTKMTSLGRGEIQKFLKQAVKAKCTYAVIEVSSHALIQSRVLGVDFDAAVLTNITQDHLDFHGSMEEYRRAKEILFQKLAKNNKPESIAILPAEDAATPYFARIPDIGITTFGVSEGDFHAESLQVRKDTQHFEVVGGEKNFAIETQLLGNFNVANILAATALTLNLGVKPSVITKAFRKITPLPGRLEAVNSGQPFRVIVDYAHTPDALEKLLRTFRAVTSGKVWIVFGATGDRDRRKRPIMGGILDKLADEVVITTDDSFTEDRQQIIDEVLAGIHRKVGEGLTVDIDRKTAITHALMQAQAGDTVLLAGKGCEQFQVIGHTKIPWDDRVIAAEILKRRFAKTPRKNVGNSHGNSISHKHRSKSRSK
jgi:UDP-N-acetylmuramoyl-L-alanyl-D-glutamate--2,6-diaminopimelate ligase